MQLRAFGLSVEPEPRRSQALTNAQPRRSAAIATRSGPPDRSRQSPNKPSRHLGGTGAALRQFASWLIRKHCRLARCVFDGLAQLAAEKDPIIGPIVRICARGAAKPSRPLREARGDARKNGTTICAEPGGRRYDRNRSHGRRRRSSRQRRNGRPACDKPTRLPREFGYARRVVRTKIIS